jgi:hypothetical protein
MVSSSKETKKQTVCGSTLSCQFLLAVRLCCGVHRHVISDTTAMRQGLDYFCIEIGGALPQRIRNLFVAGFTGAVIGFRIHARAQRQEIR